MNIKYTKAVVLATAAGFFGFEVCGFAPLDPLDPLDPRAKVPPKRDDDGNCLPPPDGYVGKNGYCYHNKQMVKQCKKSYKKCISPNGSGNLNANCNTYDGQVRKDICPAAAQATGASDFCPNLNTPGAEFTERSSCGDASNEADCLKTYVKTDDWYGGCTFKANTCSEKTRVIKDVSYTVVQECAEVCTVNLATHVMLDAPNKCGQGDAIIPGNQEHNLNKRLTNQTICEKTLTNYVAFGANSDVQCTWDTRAGCYDGQACRCANGQACVPMAEVCCDGTLTNCKDCSKRE